jgi:hypothetical protein
MQKLSPIFLLLLAAGCAKTAFTPFDGDQTLIGGGGFLKAKHAGISVYESGLPRGMHCRTIGKVTDDHQSESSQYQAIAKKIAQYGGNVIVLEKKETKVTGSTHYGSSRSFVSLSSVDTEDIVTYTVYDCK